MLTLPDAILPVLHPFATLFRNPTWLKAQILLVGAILAPGQRTVAAALRVMGRSDHLDYARYHEVLNRAVWSPRQAARILLMLLLQHLDQGDGPLVFGIDETLERRRGPKIKARGVYRDAVRSSRQQLVKASGLRWISLMWLGHVPWAGRYWALPFLTVLAPSERYYRQRGRRHKKLTDWARQMILQLRRWLPHRPLVLVGDSSYAVLDLLHCCQSLAQPVTLIARLRLDAALYEPAPPRQPGQNGRPPLKGRRLPALKTLLDLPTVSWATVSAAWYDGTTRTLGTHLANGGLVPLGQAAGTPALGLGSGPPRRIHSPGLALHRSVGGPDADPGMVCAALATGGHLQEVRAHLGVETQRQWSDQAIARTTPILMGLFSWTTLAAHLLRQQRPSAHRTAAWYAKPSPTFVDAIALVRRHLWLASEGFSLSAADPDIRKVPAASVPPTCRFPCVPVASNCVKVQPCAGPSLMFAHGHDPRGRASPGCLCRFLPCWRPIRTLIPSADAAT